MAFGKKQKEAGESQKASARVMSKSQAAKKAVKGVDMGKKNVPGKTGFGAVEAKAAQEYGSKAAGERVAGAMFQKMRAKGKL